MSAKQIKQGGSARCEAKLENKLILQFLLLPNWVFDRPAVPNDYLARLLAQPIFLEEQGSRAWQLARQGCTV